MVEILNCPTRDELVRLNNDKLPADRSETLYDHIETCDQCAEFYADLEEPADDFAERLARLTPNDLDRARQAIEEDTLKETATSIWGKVSPMLESQHREPSLALPCQLGQYEVTRLIDYGGMGEVYEARHVRLKRPVAVKVILGYRQDDPASHQHFLKEMETAGQLEHPNLVRAYDAWEHEGCLFLAQELLIGDSLQDLVNRGDFGGHSEVVEALLGTCRALEQLSEKGFVHRDVKPANIMRLEDGTIKLIDYGLAVAADTRRSAIRVGAGTMGYMSPEQAHGGHPIDHRTDIYAAGRVLKYLLSKVDEKATDAKQEPLAEKLFSLSQRMTQQEPGDRPQSAYAVIVQLEQLQKKPVEPENAAIKAAVPHKSAASPGTLDVEVENAATLKSKEEPVHEAGPVRKTKPRFARPGWIALLALLVLAAGLGAYEIIFKTDRQSTVTVENYQPGDVIRLTSEEGEVRKVELGDEAKFVVGPGTYKLALEAPGNRQLNPGNIRVTGRDQLTVRIEDRLAADSGGLTKKTDSGSKPAKNSPSQPAKSTVSGDLPVLSEELRVAREEWSKRLGLPETVVVNLPGDANYKLEFVLIPPGTFQMGLPESLSMMSGNKPEWVAYSKPAHEVTITHPFYISRYEVTQKQFRDVIGDGLTPVDGDGTKLPATSIPWQPCLDYCARLTNTGTNIPNGATVRLPTEAEWEYACRAGTTTRFWSGDQIGPNQASLRNQGREMKLEPIDAFSPNPFGLHNMHGNVMEWCSDWFSADYYASDPGEDPRGPETGTEKVLRGGGFSNPPFAATSYWRQGYEPGTRSNSIGLRPVLELPSK